jgi:hypothetical protein
MPGMLSLLGDDHLHRQPGAPCLFLRCFEVFQEVWQRISLLGRSIWQYEICIRREQINLSGTAPIQELEKIISYHSCATRSIHGTLETQTQLCIIKFITQVSFHLWHLRYGDNALMVKVYLQLKNDGWPNIRGPVPRYPSQMQLVDEVHKFELQIHLVLSEKKG